MNNEKILIVDDEQDLRMLMKEALIRAGYANTMSAASAGEALKLMQQQMPDLILLDVMMPGMDGFELLEKIREISTVPVIMLTARGEAEDKYKGFSRGADDYIVKPFLMQELLFRIQAVLRRAYPETHRIVRLRSSTVDLDKAEVTAGDRVSSLTAKEYTIFMKLYENADCIVSTASLCQTVVGEIWSGYENTLMTHIRHLREKIEADPGNPQSLITVRGLGYKLVTR
ncbi:MAG: response regulator transcription factor [Eubacteriaceae bacterium]